MDELTAAVAVKHLYDGPMMEDAPPGGFTDLAVERDPQLGLVARLRTLLLAGGVVFPERGVYTFMVVCSPAEARDVLIYAVEGAFLALVERRMRSLSLRHYATWTVGAWPGWRI